MTEIEKFLLDRLKGGSDFVGISSNAMVREALDGDPVDRWDYPHDLSDLSRCCMTFARAPAELKDKMLPRLLDFCGHAEAGFPIQRALEPEPARSDPGYRIGYRFGWWLAMRLPQRIVRLYASRTEP